MLVGKDDACDVSLEEQQGEDCQACKHYVWYVELSLATSVSNVFSIDHRNSNEGQLKDGEDCEDKEKYSLIARILLVDKR